MILLIYSGILWSQQTERQQENIPREGLIGTWQAKTMYKYPRTMIRHLNRKLRKKKSFLTLNPDGTYIEDYYDIKGRYKNQKMEGFWEYDSIQKGLFRQRKLSIKEVNELYDCGCNYVNKNGQYYTSGFVAPILMMNQLHLMLYNDHCNIVTIYARVTPPLVNHQTTVSKKVKNPKGI